MKKKLIHAGAFTLDMLLLMGNLWCLTEIYVIDTVMNELGVEGKGWVSWFLLGGYLICSRKIFVEYMPSNLLRPYYQEK